MQYSQNKLMTCYQAQLTMALYMENDPCLTTERCQAFEIHLQNCSECAKEYEESKFVIRLVKQSVSKDTFAIVESEKQPTKHRITFEESWDNLLHRYPDLAITAKHQKHQRLLHRVSAVAACLVIGASIFLAFSIYSKPKIASKSASQQVAFAPKPSVKIELVSKNGRTLIPANRQIASNNELKTLVIDGKHRLTMNTNTVLVVEPLVEHSNIGCQVKLVSGQIYTHVQHDGNPFVVDTAHGEAVITGTTFDVKATEDSTTLVVSEGTVRFKSENGVVNVATGQTSEIVGQSSPSIPLSCNTDELTAWATGYKPGPALAQVKSNTDPWDLPTSLRRDPIVLDETDYDRWVEWERDWFKQEFPWIFQLKEALAKEGIEADYPELLIETGDVWQFVCLDISPARFSVINPDSLLNIASNYGFDKQWLLENVPAVKYAIEKPILTNNTPAGLKAFEQWLKYLDETNELEPPTPIYLFRASKYLAETRSLIWFTVRDGQYDLTSQERIEILGLLQEEVTAACQCQNDDMYPLDEQEKSSCDEDISKTADERIVGYINTIKAVEERIGEYENHKCFHNEN